MRFYAALLLSVLWSSTFGQAIENVTATFTGGKVNVSYDLVRTKENQLFSIDLYSSHNNFTSPLNQVSGDVGKNVKPGNGKRIEWNASAELTSAYKGELTFRIKAEPIAITLAFKSPAAGGSVKKGKQAQVQWEGGSSDNVRIELYKGNERVSTIGETRNSGQYTWSVPKDLEKGSYTLKVTSGKENATSGVFLVKSKPPVLIIAGSALVVGGLIAILGGGGGGKEPTSVDADLPAAPVPK